MNLFVYIIIPFIVGKNVEIQIYLWEFCGKNLTHLWELAEITVATLITSPAISYPALFSLLAASIWWRCFLRKQIRAGLWKYRQPFPT